jgi:hypothetical protein
MKARREAVIDACLEKTEANPEEIEFESEHQEVPKEEPQ